MERSATPVHPPLTAEQRDRYLERLGWTGDTTADLATLQALHRRHLVVVPFENLDIHLGVPIELDLDRIVTKLVDRRRGGFCFELNGGFGALLRALGFEVHLLEGRVYEQSGEVVPFGHMALRVELDSPYLVDVGFGRSFDEPIRLDDRGDQADTTGTYRLEDARDGELDLIANGQPVYQLALTSRAFADFTDACHYHQTSPRSVFTQGNVCSRRTEHGRCTLAGTSLIETVDGVRSEVVIDDAEEVRETLATRFDIELSVDEIDALLGASRRADYTPFSG